MDKAYENYHRHCTWTQVLHTEVEPPFTISELNSSAVYLTEEFAPKVCPLVSSLQIKLDNYNFA